MPRIIYAPGNGPACSMEDLVAQYIDWSPTIYNDVSQGFYMVPEQMQYCPTKAQIKNSESMSVTLYKEAVYENSSIIQFKKGTTYKFNGEVGQFPKLYVLDMYPDYKPTKQYSSKELVRLCDVSAFYNHHDITLRLNNFALKSGKFPRVSSNLVLDSSNVQIVTDSAIYPYDMKEETYFSWSLPTIDYIENNEQYKQDKFTYNVIGYDDLAGSYTLGKTINVTDVEKDVIIDVYAEKKDLINVYISTDGRIRVINYLKEIVLTDEDEVEQNIIIDPPSTYATYKTDYPVEKYDRFKFLIQPDDEDALENYSYEFKKNGVIIHEASSLAFTSNSFIYEYGLTYRDTEGSAPNSYTLFIKSKEKYIGNNIRIIINNEVADSLSISVSETGDANSFEKLSSQTSSSKMQFSYVIQEEGTTKLYIKVVGDESKLKDYDLIQNVYATNNRGDSTSTVKFGKGTSNIAVLTWTHGVGRNTIIYIMIDRIQLLPITIKRLTEEIEVYTYNNFTTKKVVFSGNSATITTTAENPSSVSLQIKNMSTSSNIINYKWYVRSKVEISGHWRVNYEGSVPFTKSGLISGKNYVLELKGGIAYTEKIVSITINNSDSTAHVSVSYGEWSEDGLVYNSLSVYENGGTTVKYKMNQGYYFRGTIHVDEDYKFSTCSYTCVFKDKNNGQMGNTISGSVQFDQSTNNFIIIIPNIPAECSYVNINTTYSSISTYTMKVISLANIIVYEYDYLNENYKVGSICTSENEYTADVTTSPAKPNEVKLKFVSASPGDYPAMTYMVYDTAPSNQPIVGETSMDITGTGGVWTSPANMFETYDGGIYFQVMSLTSNGRTIYIYSDLTNVNLIIKDKYNSDNVIVDFSNNEGSNYATYITTSGYYDRVSWGISWPNGYIGCDLELFGSNDATSPSDGNWDKVGSTKTSFEDTTLNFTWGNDLDGNSATEYKKYYIKFSNYIYCSFEYIGISTKSQSIDDIPYYSPTNFIPTMSGKSFNVLFRTPTTSGTISIISPVLNNGVWVNPDGTEVTTSIRKFNGICSYASTNNLVIDHTDGYTYIFYRFNMGLELYGLYYVDNVSYIYSQQTIRKAITFTNPKVPSETINIDVYLDEICKISWNYESVVPSGSVKEFDRNSTTGLYFWAKLEKMKSDNCDTSSSKIVYEFADDDLRLTPPDDFNLVEMSTNPSILYGGSAKWTFSHKTFNENQTFMAILQHAGRTLSLPLKAITPPKPPTYDTYFWYTQEVTPYLNGRWYWWTTAAPNTTLLNYATGYGLGVHFNTPHEESVLNGGYYKCGPSDMALIRYRDNITGYSPSPTPMVPGETYILVYNTSSDKTWMNAGVKFKYSKPLYNDKVLICDGVTNDAHGYFIGCHYQ